MTSGHGVCVGHILVIRFNAFLRDAHAADRLAGGGIAHQIEGRDLEQNHYFTGILVQETKYKLTDDNSFFESHLSFKRGITLLG